MGKPTSAELSDPQRAPPKGKPFPKGKSGNPGGQSKEKRAFLDRLTNDDAGDVYEAFMDLVREGNPPAVIKAVEYLAGKPPNAKADNDAIEKGLTVIVQSLAETKGRKP